METLCIFQKVYSGSITGILIEQIFLWHLADRSSFVKGNTDTSYLSFNRLMKKKMAVFLSDPINQIALNVWKS